MTITSLGAAVTALVAGGGGPRPTDPVGRPIPAWARLALGAEGRLPGARRTAGKRLSWRRAAPRRPSGSQRQVWWRSPRRELFGSGRAPWAAPGTHRTGPRPCARLGSPARAAGGRRRI